VKLSAIDLGHYPVSIVSIGTPTIEAVTSTLMCSMALYSAEQFFKLLSA